MKFRLTTLLAITSLLWGNVLAQKADKNSIFNGKDLSGWVEPDNNIWWTVKDGLLTVENGPNRKGSILWTEGKYRDFIVKADFKMGKGVVDSGIFLKGESPQVQIGISGSLKRDMTGSPYIPGKGYPKEAEGVSDLLKLQDWNTMKVKSKGSTIMVWLNGKKVLKYTVEKMPEEGPIGLQLHPNNEMSISFRNISAKEI
ncbi:MAG: DUF1080 domain-containing protein [Bacteroidetes bacterium]|nr:DUF1080 domain-containing protein [Bacteroidota bacterium]